MPIIDPRGPESFPEAVERSRIELGEKIAAYYELDVPPPDDDETSRPSPIPKKPIESDILD